MRTKTVFVAICLLIFVWVRAGQAVSPGDPFLQRLEGTWQGNGKTLGMSARLLMKWEWVLGSKFLRLSLRNEMQSPSGSIQVFEGHAYYEPAGQGKYEARWFDSRGLSFPIKGASETDALTAQWGTPEQEQGKSVYKFLEPGKLEVLDSVKQKDGTWKEFGRFIVVRQ